MIKSTTIVGLSGSLRKASSNTKLLKYIEKKIKLKDGDIIFHSVILIFPLQRRFGKGSRYSRDCYKTWRDS